LLDEWWKDGESYQQWVPLPEYCYRKRVQAMADELKKLIGEV